jgi:hypothetical protein
LIAMRRPNRDGAPAAAIVGGPFAAGAAWVFTRSGAPRARPDGGNRRGTTFPESIASPIWRFRARSRSPTRVSASSPSIAEGVVILARVKLGWRFAQHAY